VNVAAVPSGEARSAVATNARVNARAFARRSCSDIRFGSWSGQAARSVGSRASTTGHHARIILVAVTGLSLAGCSTDYFRDYFKSAPTSVQLQLESTPPGAEAKTSIGPSCKTPCSITLTAPEGGFTVNYTLNKFQPATVPVQVTRTPGDLLTAATTKIDPNPVLAELQPVTPPKPTKSMRPKRVAKKPTETASPAPAASAFPDPGQPVAPAPNSTR
jgi:hypothetical protein